MLIGHAPLGYIIAVSLRRTFGPAVGLAVASIAGGLAPDIDMIRFWFIDNSQYNHRYYFTHWPFFWLLCAALLLPSLWMLRRRLLLPACGFFVGVASHLLTDTVMGPVRWFAPFYKFEYELFQIPAQFSHWILSAIGYWTFLLDIAVCMAAAVVWIIEKRRANFLVAQIPPYQS